MKESLKKQFIARLPEKLGESVLELNSDSIKPSNTLNLILSTRTVKYCAYRGFR